jgi:hypothetical protein
MRMRKFLVVGLATIAAGASVALAPAASANGPCGYVTTDAAQVRENPSINSVVRKTVPANYPVTGPVAINFCGWITGTDGRAWVPVDCSCATDGVGYIINDKLRPTVNA